jgi:enoyl-CoA hydratase/carnithine racemase
VNTEHPTGASDARDGASPSPVRLQHSGDVRELWLTRPPVNALDHAMVAALSSVVGQLEAGDGCRALLVASDVPVFAAGADIRMLDEAGARLDDGFRTEVQSLFRRIEELPFPVVAAIGGHALGGGWELALACDLRLVADTEGLKLGLPESRIGLLPGAGGTQRMSRLLGKSRAMDLLLTGRSIDARTGLDWGLVNEVVDAGSLLERAREVAHQFAAGPTAAYASIKRCVLHALHGDIGEGLERERAEAAALMATQDAAEGLRSFIERRRPVFVGF